MQQLWQVRPHTPPPVARHCRRCGPSRFLSTEKFRVNAQKKTLDIWLIWQCERCGQTWNMEILSRVARQALAPAQLRAYMENDQALAFQCAFDPALHRKNGSQPCWEAVDFTVEGEWPALSPGGRVDIELRCEVPFPVRVLAVFAKKLALPMEALRHSAEQGLLQCTAEQQDILKQRLQGTQTFRLAAAPALDNQPVDPKATKRPPKGDVAQSPKKAAKKPEKKRTGKRLRPPVRC